MHHLPERLLHRSMSRVRDNHASFFLGSMRRYRLWTVWCIKKLSTHLVDPHLARSAVHRRILEQERCWEAIIERMYAFNLFNLLGRKFNAERLDIALQVTDLTASHDWEDVDCLVHNIGKTISSLAVVVNVMGMAHLRYTGHHRSFLIGELLQYFAYSKVRIARPAVQS